MSGGRQGGLQNVICPASMNAKHYEHVCSGPRWNAYAARKGHAQPVQLLPCLSILRPDTLRYHVLTNEDMALQPACTVGQP
jgi:hypothetical protein